MKLLTCFAAFLCLSFAVHAQFLIPKDSIQFPVDTLNYWGTTDCWGYVSPEGKDYAIVGNVDHVAFVRAGLGTVVDTVQGPTTGGGAYHRDMVTHKGYCYVVSERFGKREGLMIIDLSPLPDSVRFVRAWTPDTARVYHHNIDVDPGTDHLYIQGYGSDIYIVDIADPENPEHVAEMNLGWVHDIHARNDTLWVARGPLQSFDVYDMSDKQNPQLIGQASGPGFGYCHNVWPSDDGRFFVTTEESTYRTVKLWELKPDGSVIPRGTYLGANHIAHNAHIRGDFIFISHYTAGMTVVDWSDPDSLVEVARYDTYHWTDSPITRGCWGVTVPSENNYVYASTMHGWLHIFKWFDGAVGVEEEVEGLVEDRPWPNPFRTVVHIPLSLERKSKVQVNVYDLNGELMDRIPAQLLAPGLQEILWNPPAHLWDGIYFVRIKIGEKVAVRKVWHRR